MSECRCSRTINDDAYVCRTCVQEATRDLTETADFLQHVDEKRARYTTNWRHGTIGRSSETPLPYDPRVGKALEPVRNALTTWARIHAEEHPDHLQPPADLTRLAVWLSEFTQWVAGRPWAHDAFDQYQRAHESMRRLFDNPPDREAIGECGAIHEDGTTCPEILAAEKGALHHDCPKCGVRHDVKKRRDALLDQSSSINVTVAEAVKMLRTTDTDVHPRLVRALIRYVPIPSSGVQVELDIKNRSRRVDAYPLGAIRDALSIYATDRDVQKEVKRIVAGRARQDAAV